MPLGSYARLTPHRGRSERVLRGLSGGVDSAVAAALLDRGHRQAAHLRLRLIETLRELFKDEVQNLIEWE